MTRNENTMNYSEPNITQRAERSPLWHDLSKQQSESLPYLLERYLLLENWNRERTWDEPHGGYCAKDEVRYLHMLIAEAVTVLLNQEARIRELELLHKR